MQGNDRFRLVVRRGPQPNQTYDLTKDVITIGRDITNDIVINDPEASRHHMRLTQGAGGYTLEDLGSTNGTFINGQRLTGAKPLSNGDMVGMGETVTLAFERVPESAGAAPAAESPFARQQPGPLAPQQPISPFPSEEDLPGSPIPQEQPAPPSYSYSPYGEAPPQAPAYDYDPYAAREEGPRSTMRWVAIGCVGILLFCCCATIAGAVIIDQACLWDQIPVVSDILNAVGFYGTC
jgi:predicted component of type VI protein secretion system